MIPESESNREDRVKSPKMDRRSFGKLMGAAVGGLSLGALFGGCGSNSSSMPVDKHACKGMNTCKGNGGCSAGDNGCAGKNSCKGKGGCATTGKHACKGQNSCKGQGGCKTGDNGCTGKNSCKGKGGCSIPMKAR
jgi:hypothetical protein